MKQQRLCRQQDERLYTNGAENLIHFAFIKQLTSELVCANSASGTFTPILPGWPHAPPSGFINSSRLIIALRFTRMIFSSRINLRSDYRKFSPPLARLSR